MSDLRDLINQFCEKAFEEIGIPTPKKFIEAKVYVNHQFPDFMSRQAFLGTMVQSMCREFGVDQNDLFNMWKEAVDE